MVNRKSVASTIGRRHGLRQPKGPMGSIRQSATKRAMKPLRAVEMIELVVLGRYKLFRECLSSMLSDLGGYSVQDFSYERKNLIQELESLCPDVVLIDVSKGDEFAEARVFQLIQRIRCECASIRIIILGVSEIEPEILRCIEEGVSGYVAKDSTAEELHSAVQLVIRGEAVCPPRLAYSMFSRLTELSRECQRSRRVDALALTPREMEVLQLIAEGLSNQRIAERLSLSIYTVKNHVHHVLDKLQVKRRAEAVEHAYQRRWLR